MIFKIICVSGLLPVLFCSFVTSTNSTGEIESSDVTNNTNPLNISTTTGPNIMPMANMDYYGGYCVREHNAVRLAWGYGPLSYDYKLANAAQRHSNTMRNQGCFSLQCPGESSLGDRLYSEGYYWFQNAQNIARYVGSCQEAVDLWMSTYSGRNIVLGSLDDVGCASAGQYFTCYYGQLYYDR